MDDCVICLEPLAAASRALRCGHRFHAPCIDSALAVTNATCPLCRRAAHENATPRLLHVRRPLDLDRSSLLRRLDRIDRLIGVLSGRIQQTAAMLPRGVLDGTLREIREIRAMLPPRSSDSATTATAVATRPVRTRRRRRQRSLQMPLRRSARLAHAQSSSTAPTAAVVVEDRTPDRARRPQILLEEASTR